MSNAMQTHGVAGWIQHGGKDPVAARKFYETVIGWTVSDWPMQDGSAYSAIMVGEGPIGGFMPHPVSQGEWTIYITVDDVDARYKAALENGAETIEAPTDYPGVGRLAKIRDPFGASIAIGTYETSGQ